MCGIVGLLAPGRRDHEGLARAISAMSGAVAHRGPDDEGDWIDSAAGVALGHRRLAIVDLSSQGHQPMLSADGRWALVLNGEIYDHEDHRRRLDAAGVKFRGHSDTEVLVELVAQGGVRAAVESVDGMFALAAWDREERRLTLARDPIGEKPLTYGRRGQLFAFGSELTALRRLPGTDDLDPDALGEYLRLGFVPAPLSILDGTQKLPAGHLLEVGADGSHGDPVPYWSLADVAARGLTEPLPDADTLLVDQAEAMLRRSVGRRLVADVPVGAFLSGGIDSSTVVALAQEVSSRPVRTFTVAVGGEDDESTAAAAVARHLGTDHTTLPLGDLDPVELAARAASLYDEPFADPSGVPTALMCAAARQHVTVALSGDGGDEVLAGYNRYRAAYGPLGRTLALPAGPRRAVARALTLPSPGTYDRLGSALPSRLRRPALGDKVHKAAGVLASADQASAFQTLVQQWAPGELVPAGRPVAALPGLAGGSVLDRMLLADQRVTLPDDMLVKVDRASMAVALEVRVPLLAPEFVAWSWRLPERAKVRDGQGKWLLRQVLDRHLPRELVDRPKLGFDPPLAAWLRGPLRDWAGDLLSTERLRGQGLLHPEPVQAALIEHLSGRRNNDYRLWTVLMLQNWLQETKGEVAR